MNVEVPVAVAFGVGVGDGGMHLACDGVVCLVWYGDGGVDSHIV